MSEHTATPCDYCVDGHEFENADSEMLGDGNFPPFVVFNISKQENEPGEFATREDAEAAMVRIISFDAMREALAAIVAADRDTDTFLPSRLYDPARAALALAGGAK
jgi:hypothetical protein